MAGTFGKIAKWALIGAGSILSIFPGLAIVGAPLIVAGTAINVKDQNTVDILSAAATNLQTGLTTAQNMAMAGNLSLQANKAKAWLTANPLMAVAVIGGVLYFLVKLFKRR